VCLLLSFKDDFLRAQQDGKIKEFWPIVLTKFFDKYASREIELNELEAEQLEDERSAQQEAEENMGGKGKKKKAKVKASTNKVANWPSFATTEAWKAAREKVSCGLLH
jgi:predicted DNA-binding protein (UPF0251 family)